MTLQEIKEQYAKEKGFYTWKDYLIMAHSHGLSEDETGYDEISKRYAKAKLEEVAEVAEEIIRKYDPETGNSWQAGCYSGMVTIKEEIQSILETPLD